MKVKYISEKDVTYFSLKIPYFLTSIYFKYLISVKGQFSKYIYIYIKDYSENCISGE